MKGTLKKEPKLKFFPFNIAHHLRVQREMFKKSIKKVQLSNAITRSTSVGHYRPTAAPMIK